MSHRVIDTPDVSILHYLHRVRAVDDGHISAAMTYLDWQAASGGDCKGSGIGRVRANDDHRGEKWDKWHRLMILLPRKQQAHIEAIVNIQSIPQSTHRTIWDERHSLISVLNRLGHLIDEINEFFLAHERELA